MLAVIGSRRMPMVQQPHAVLSAGLPALRAPSAVCAEAVLGHHHRPHVHCSLHCLLPSYRQRHPLQGGWR